VAIIYYNTVRLTISDDEATFVVEVDKGSQPNDPDGFVWQTLTPNTEDLISGAAWSTALGVDNDWWEGL